MDRDYKRIRNFLGYLGMSLPILCILACLLVSSKPNTWWYSISATYYLTPVLTAILSAVGFFLICYRSYDTIDTVVNTSAGVFALLIVMFPCKVDWIDPLTLVGVLQVPMKYSYIIHNIAACMLFILLAYNSYFLFSRGNNKVRNNIYKVCGIVMIVAMILFALLTLFNAPGWIVMIIETILLVAFGVSWLTKGGAFRKEV